MKEIERRELIQFRQMVIAARVAQYDEKSFKKVLKGLANGK